MTDEARPLDEMRQLLQGYVASHRGITDEADAVAALLARLDVAERERDRLKHEIEFVVALGQPYGISLQPSWIERLQNVLLSLRAAAGEGET